MCDFETDIVDLFERRRGGHVQHWLYTDAMRGDMSGSDLWRAFTRSSRNYYIPKTEARLIREKGPGMIAGSNADTVVDFGVGSRSAVMNKAIPIIRGLKNVKIYSGIDISPAMLREASKTVREICPDIRVETHNKDFHHDEIYCGGTRRLGLLFGCSVTNQEMKADEGFPYRSIVENLRDYRRHLNSGDELLVTYDANPDGQGAMKAYDNDNWSRHVTGLMYDVARLLKTDGDFDPAAWRHEMIWNDEVRVVHQYIVAEKAQTLVMKDREFHFNKHQRFVAINNFKFRERDFNDLCEAADFRLYHAEQDGTLRLQHLAM